MLEFGLELNLLNVKLAIFVLVSWVNAGLNVFCYLFTSSTFANFIRFIWISPTWPFVQENVNSGNLYFSYTTEKLGLVWGFFLRYLAWKSLSALELPVLILL